MLVTLSFSRQHCSVTIVETWQQNLSFSLVLQGMDSILTCKHFNWKAIYFRQLLSLPCFHATCFCTKVFCPEGAWSYVGDNSIGKGDDSPRPLQWIVTGVAQYVSVGRVTICASFSRTVQILGILFHGQTMCHVLCFSKTKVTVGIGRPAKIHQVCQKA